MSSPEKGAFAASLASFGTSIFINSDALIVRENVTRYQATGKRDVAYPATLSLAGEHRGSSRPSSATSRHTLALPWRGNPLAWVSA